MARKQYVGKSKLSSLGFEKDGHNKYVRKTARGEDKVLWLDSKGRVIRHSGIPTDSDGNLLLYRRH